MRTIDRRSGFAYFLIIACLCVSCAPGMRLNTQGAEDSEVTGTYTVILYGCNFSEDLETIAFLDREGDQYVFEPYAPDFKFRTMKSVGAKEALAKAADFLHCNTAFLQTQLSRILAPHGEIIGYEARPRYRSFVYGSGEVLLRDYRLQDNTVTIWIRLAPWVEDMLSGGDGRIDSR